MNLNIGMSQKKLLVKYLKYMNDWIPAYSLRGTNTPFGFLGHQADRRLRELLNEGYLERRLSGKFVEYRYLPPKSPQKTLQEQQIESEEILRASLC